MRFVLKKSCCRCSSLKTGTSVIAYLGIFGSIGGIIKAVIALCSPYIYELYVMCTLLGFACVHLITSVLLIISVSLRSSNLVIPWLVEMAFVLIAVIILSVFLFASKAVSTLLPIFLLLTCGLHLYFWWVVFSFHYELKPIQCAEENKPTRRNGNEMETRNLKNIT